MVRLEGSVVAPLAMTMIGDWMLETAESLETILASAELSLVGPKGTEDVQVVPSGPGEGGDGLLQMLLAAINSARQELVLTTPYFVPDDSMLRAFRGRAGRGMCVDMVLPERVDSLLTRYASRSFTTSCWISASASLFTRRACCTRTRSRPTTGLPCSARSISTCEACG